MATRRFYGADGSLSGPTGGQTGGLPDETLRDAFRQDETLLGQMAARAYQNREVLFFPIWPYLVGTNGMNPSVEDICTKPEVLARVTVEAADRVRSPVAQFPMNLGGTASLFGAKTVFPGGLQPPKVQEDMFADTSFGDLDRFEIPPIGTTNLGVRLKAMDIAREELKAGDRFLFMEIATGFATTASMLSGTTAMSMALMGDRINSEDYLRSIFALTERGWISYLNELAKRKVAIVVSAEPYPAAVYGPDFIRSHVVPGQTRIIEHAHNKGIAFITHMCGPTGLADIYENLWGTGTDGISIDHESKGGDMAKALQVVSRLNDQHRPNNRTIVLGNLPTIPAPSKTGGPSTRGIHQMSVDDVRNVTSAMLLAHQRYPEYSAASACQIPVNTPIENLMAFWETVRDFRRQV